MQFHWNKALAVCATGCLALGVGLASASSAYADVGSGGYQYHPTVGTIYAPTAEELAQANKGNNVLYPKSAQLDDGRLVAAFERSIGDPVGQTIPVYKSDDYGTTWQKLSDVKAPAFLSRDPKYAKYTSNWTNPYLYVLPQDVGDLKKGTLLLASVVSGDDAYYREQKAADPTWVPTHDGDRQDTAIALYSSTDDGASWNVVNIVAQGGWEANYGNTFSAANIYHQQDPVWEPYLMVYDNQLVAYYSDENDYDGFDPATGALTLDPENTTGQVTASGRNPNDTGSQILDHRTWNGRAGSTWSGPILDVYGRFTAGSGFSGRPGMTNVVPTTDGKWILTAETGITKVSDNPLRFWDAPDLSFPAHHSGSPVIIKVPDPADPSKWSLVFNDSNTGNDVYVDASGRSDGPWLRYQTPIGNGYSRNLQYVPQTGRLMILRGTWGGAPITYAEVDLGGSQGAYYALVNRKTGQVLGTGGKTQDANLTGNVPDIQVEAAASPVADTQLWHLIPTGSGAATVNIINRSGGRAVAIWQGSATPGARLAQWSNDDASDKQWTLAANGSGYYEIRSAGTTLLATASSAGGPVTLQARSTDDPESQEWEVVQQAPLASDLTAGTHDASLVGSGTILAGSTLTVDTSASAAPGGGLLHAGEVATAYVMNDAGRTQPLGEVALDAGGKGTLRLPPELAAGDYRLVLQFADLPLLWRQVSVGVPTTTTAVAAPPTVKQGKSSKVIVKVRGSGGTPTGTVRVADGPNLVGSAVLAKGKATVALTGDLSVGTHVLTVTYSGDRRFTASSDAVQLTVKVARASANGTVHTP